MFLVFHSPVAIYSLSAFWLAALWVRRRDATLLVVLMTLAVLFFFRDVGEIINHGNHILAAPCDGRVMAVEEQNGKIRVSVRLSLLDRHVQIVPYSGQVTQVAHKPGTFHPVYFFQKTDLNERLETHILTKAGTVVVTQIAGQIARRIRSFLEVGQSVKKGDRLGLIEFGSRVDITLPSSSWSVLVRPGDAIRIGQTFATFK